MPLERAFETNDLLSMSSERASTRSQAQLWGAAERERVREAAVVANGHSTTGTQERPSGISRFCPNDYWPAGPRIIYIL